MQPNVRHFVIPIVLALVIVTGPVACTATKPGPTASASTRSSSRATRSQAVLDGRIAAGEPGCSVAVARKGRVVWQGVRGLADIESGEPITPNTIFDIGSVSKQFPALAVLMLQAAGKLSIDDKLSTYVKGLPTWADRLTLAQLMHQTSGIPDYVPIVEQHNLPLDQPVTTRQQLTALHEVTALTSAPGSTWDYSNSNYLLLGEVVHLVSGRTLPTYLATMVFKPLRLSMVVNAGGAVAGKAVSYDKTAATFVPQVLRWEMVGAGGIQTTPTQLARWGDNYRTGAIGGKSLLVAQLRGAVLTSHGNGAAVDPDQVLAYGAGIAQAQDKALGHDGRWGDFVTFFMVSPDRGTSFAVACNRADLDLGAIVDDVRSIWF